MGNAQSPAAAVDPDTGDVYMMWTPGNKEIWWMKSTDRGVSWSAPVNITAAVGILDSRFVATGPGGAIFTKTKRLILTAGNLGSPGSPNNGTDYYFYSDDFAKTWHVGKSFPQGGECQVAQLADGTLVISCRWSPRGHTPTRSFAVSHDQGDTWKLHYQADILG